MKIEITITTQLDNDLWGFEDLLNGRPLNDETKKEIIELAREDIIALLDGAKWGVHDSEGQSERLVCKHPEDKIWYNNNNQMQCNECGQEI